MPFVRLEPAPVDFLIWIFGGFLFLQRPKAFWGDIPYMVRWGLVLLIISHVSLAWAPNLSRGLFFLLATLEMFVILVLFIFAGKSISSLNFKQLSWAYICGSTIAALLGITAYFGLLPFREIFLFGEMRAMGWFQDPNVFGAHLVPAVLLLWGLEVEHSESNYKIRLSTGAVAFILTLGVLLSGSRTAWGGLLLGLALYVLLFSIQTGSWKWLRKRWIISLGMLLAFALIFQPQVLSMVKDRAKFIQPYDYQRFSKQEEAISESASPAKGIVGYLTGHGPGQSEVILNYATHNLYLRVLYELGAVGVAGFILLLMETTKIVRRTFETYGVGNITLTVVLVSLLIMSFLIDTLHWRHLFVFWGLILARNE